MHTIEVIEEQLSQLQKLNYNQFFWWRRWGRKIQPLQKYSPLIDKINNGDYADSPYRFQIHYCDWEIDQVYKQFEFYAILNVTFGHSTYGWLLPSWSRRYKHPGKVGL